MCTFLLTSASTLSYL